MAAISTPLYIMYMDNILVPYNPTRLRFSIGERNQNEFAITRVPPQKYGIPAITEILTFDLRIPRDRDTRSTSVSVIDSLFDDSVSTPLNKDIQTKSVALTGQIFIDKLREDMYLRRPIPIKISRYQYLPSERGNSESTGLRSSTPSMLLNNNGEYGDGIHPMTTHASEYIITNLDITETSQSWFYAIANVTMRKYYEPKRIVGNIVSRNVGNIISTQFQMRQITKVEDYSTPIICSTNTCGLEKLFHTNDLTGDDSLLSVPEGAEIINKRDLYKPPAVKRKTPPSTSESIRTYITNARTALADTVNEVGRWAEEIHSVVSPYISTIGRVYMMYQMGIPGLAASALSGVPYLGGILGTISQQYNSQNNFLTGLGNTIGYSLVPGWVELKSEEKKLENASNDIDINKIYWGLGWDPTLHSDHFDYVPLIERPFKLGTYIPPSVLFGEEA